MPTARTAKGIVLAGGSGTRLAPLTRATSKQLLPVYDKPMVYYPLSVLMLAGIRDILLVVTPRDRPAFERLLGDGAELGVHFRYVEQTTPRGVADGLVLGASFAAGERVALILGDNLFYGQGLETMLLDASGADGATLFAYPVRDPSAFGVVELGPDGEVRSVEEKPEHPRSNFAITGLYFLDADAVSLAQTLAPSARGELEITDLLGRYLARNALRASRFGRGFTWLDTGSPDALLRAASFVQTVQERQGWKIACLEEIAWRKGYIDDSQLLALSAGYANTYGAYLRGLLGA